MEVYIQLIFVLVIVKYCLKAALTGRLWGITCYAVFASLVALALYPIVVEQPVTIISSVLSNQKFVTDGVVITTLEAVAGIFVSVYLLDNYFMPRGSRKKILFGLKIIPGVLFFFALAYFELMFFKVSVGMDFLTTAMLYSLIVFVGVMAFSLLIGWALKGESMKLELKILLNMGILIIGLLVNSSVADYNLSHAETAVEWGALFTLLGLIIILFVIGIYLPKLNIKSLFKIN